LKVFYIDLLCDFANIVQINKNFKYSCLLHVAGTFIIAVSATMLPSKCNLSCLGGRQSEYN